MGFGNKTAPERETVSLNAEGIKLQLVRTTYLYPTRSDAPLVWFVCVRAPPQRSDYGSVYQHEMITEVSLPGLLTSILRALEHLGVEIVQNDAQPATPSTYELKVSKKSETTEGPK